MYGNTGNIGGIPVRKELNKGVTAPTIIAYGKLRTNPAIRIGICIGKNVGPVPNAWNAIGKTTPNDIKRPDKINSLTVLFLIKNPLQP
jgi:hypothetical protein